MSLSRDRRGGISDITARSARHSGCEDGQCCSDIVRCFPDAVRTSRTNWPCTELYLRFSRSNSIFAPSLPRLSHTVPIIARIAASVAFWGHGCYERKADRRADGDLNPGKADRRADGDLNPVAVPRFQCPSCRRTCSRLPLCICPRRWYGWALQQQVLQLLIAGASLRRTAAIFALGYHTVRRWWRWLSTAHEDFYFHLRSRLTSLGRSVDFAAFWLACLQLMPLCEAMAWLDHDGVAVP
jgi:hypothetical protein